MANIQRIETKLPQHCYNNQEVTAIGSQWLKNHPEQFELFSRFLTASHTGNRHFCIPADSCLALNGLASRAQAFEQHGPELGIACTKATLEKESLKPSAVDTFVFSSCSCPTIPSIDTSIAQHVGFKPTISRLPFYQHGCAGGMAGLSLANQFARQGQMVMLTSVELCSLVFQPTDISSAHLVGAALFGDGAASVLITPENTGLQIVDTFSFLIPGTRHLMGYDIFDTGMHLRLDKELPKNLALTVPDLVHGFLASHSLRATDINWWLFHPGGVKILSYLEEAFSLAPHQCPWSRQVLREVGNLSSATILFVIKEFMDSHISTPGDYALAVGIGPGLTVELILLQSN